MSNKIANDLIRYAELVEDGALISPEEMNCASVMRLAAEALAQPAVTESHKQEPIGEVVTAGVIRWKDKYPSLGTKLYTTPPQRKEPEQEPVPAAMKTVIEAMQQDPDYAWGWHCNIAMSFVDAGGDHYTGNQGAARFMRTLANVEPAHELPFSPPQRIWVGLTEQEAAECWSTSTVRTWQAIEAKLKEKNERLEKNNGT